MSFYSDLAQEAEDVLREFGNVGILRRTGLDDYDPATSTTIPDTPIDESVVAAVFDIEEEAMNGSLIQRGDKNVIMSVVGVEPPRVTDLFIWVDGTYTIVDPKVLAPSGERVLYSLQVRK